VAERIAAEGGNAHVHPCDLSELDQIAAMADEVLAEHGRVDILVNNAGRSIRLASKAALDAFSRSIASEIVDDRVNMPLVRTR
jgi:short-subunit dehydrogenase involved in D-alanine esterification of teichoic acids